MKRTVRREVLRWVFAVIVVFLPAIGLALGLILEWTGVTSHGSTIALSITVAWPPLALLAALRLNQRSRESALTALLIGVGIFAGLLAATFIVGLFGGPSVLALPRTSGLVGVLRWVFTHLTLAWVGSLCVWVPWCGWLAAAHRVRWLLILVVSQWAASIAVYVYIPMPRATGIHFFVGIALSLTVVLLWSLVSPGHQRTDRLRCPNCEYNLTGLGAAHCPECGAKIELVTYQS